LDKTNAALPAVTITILNHPEFGQTLSRADGMFDLVVSGGGPLTINYAKAGLLSAQRQVQVPWQNYAIAPDVILIPQDTQVSTIQLTGLSSMQLGPPGRSTLAPNATQVARGSLVTDADGSRQATLIFQAATQATMIMPDGSTSPISTLHVRATEYTVGANGPMAMPAALPPTSAYTYAVNLSVDEATTAGASRVMFNKPVLVYLENFLGFPVGIGVPVGSYDKGQGVWAASDNGRVVKILSITGGLADLDTTGNGAVDNGVLLGVTADERQQLANLYKPGQSMWRVAVDHFSDEDFNWGVVPPSDAVFPSVPAPGVRAERDDPCHTKRGSLIDCQNQTLKESIHITGTRFNLNYQSDRVPGRKDAFRLVVPLSGASIPNSLQEIDLVVMVAGRQFTQQYARDSSNPPVPNLTATFTAWDGKDIYGRQTQGLQPVTVRVEYVYQGLYTSGSATFAVGGGMGVISQRGEQKITFFQEFHTFLGIWDSSAQGLGAWSLAVHHGYDVIGKALYLGDGSQRSVADKALNATINTFAGNGLKGDSGDGGPATAASLAISLVFPGLASGPDGSLYIADGFNHSIRRVAPNGVITTYAGNGTGGFSGDGGSATSAMLSGPTGLAVGPDGSLYIADTVNHRIRRVAPNGVITTYAGNGTSGFSGDGGPAINAMLSNPIGLAIGPDASLYIQDDHRVRRVAPEGTISTFAGTGNFGFGQDGVPATAADLNLTGSYGLAAAPDGSLYIADVGRVWRVGPDGIIRTFAGNGTGPVSDGDGGPAAAATVPFPAGLALGPDGSLYIYDIQDDPTFNNRVRRVGPDGIITTFAGGGSPAGGLEEGGPANGAPLGGGSNSLALGPNGSLYVSDLSHEQIRRVSSLPGFQLSDILIGSQDGSEVYVFNGAGLHQRTLNALTGATRFAFNYDSKPHLVAVTDGDGNVTTVEHDANGNPTAIVAPFGQRTTLAVDPNGYLASVADPAGGSFTMTYTPDGLLTQFTNPTGNTSSMTYDSIGRLSHDTDAAGGFTTLTRTDADRSFTVSLKSALNRTTTYQIQNLSTGAEQRTNTLPDGTQTQLIIGTNGSRKTTLADGTVINLLPGPDPRFGMQTPLTKSLSTTTGGLTSTITTQRTAMLSDPIDPLSVTSQTDTITFNGRTFTNSFDAATRAFTKTTPGGRQSTATLDAQGRVTRSQVSGLLATTFTYDPHGRFAAITQGTGTDIRTTRFSYTDGGYLQAVTDPQGRTLSFQYDAAGRVSNRTLPDGPVIGYGYDATGNLTSLVPSGRPAHSFSRTPLGFLSQYAPPLVGATGNTIYTYNSDRQLTLVTRPDNTTVGLAYDGGGRLNDIAIGRGVYTYSYDSTTGHLLSITAPDHGVLSYGYQGKLLASRTWSGVVAGTVRAAYDNDFRVSSFQVNGAVINFSYDADGLITQAGNLTLNRDPQKNGLLTSTTLGALTEIYSYNGFGELVGSSAVYNGTPLLVEQYVRDVLGRITQRTETVDGITNTFSYAYDLGGHLSQVTLNGITVVAYVYDSNGNRISVTRNGINTAGTYDNQDRLRQYGSSTFDYSPSGDLKNKTVSGQTTTYVYDELGNLLSVTLPTGGLIEYIIDGHNRRIGKKVGGKVVKGFLYNSQLHPIAELDGNNNVVTLFIYVGLNRVPVYMVKNSKTYRILKDHLGSPRLVVDVATGTVVQRMDYDAFGQVTQDTNPGFQPFGFAGGLYDSETSLVRFGSRDYDAEVGRWTTKDPIVFYGGDTNLYAYVLNDPVNFSDPSGKQPTWYYRWEYFWKDLFRAPSKGDVVEALAKALEGEEYLHERVINPDTLARERLGAEVTDYRAVDPVTGARAPYPDPEVEVVGEETLTTEELAALEAAEAERSAALAAEAAELAEAEELAGIVAEILATCLVLLAL
jgi:RHS repeat-associated protein